MADFVGKINLFDGVVTGCAAGRVRVRVRGARPHPGSTRTSEAEFPTAPPVSVALRPEKIRIHREAPEDGSVSVKGQRSSTWPTTGISRVYRVRTPSGRIIEVSAQNRRRDARRFAEWDDEVYLTWDAESVQVLTE